MLYLRFDDPLRGARWYKFKIFIDNQRVCDIKFGETKELAVEKGEHVISTGVTRWWGFTYKKRFIISDKDVNINITPPVLLNMLCYMFTCMFASILLIHNVPFLGILAIVVIVWIFIVFVSTPLFFRMRDNS